MSVALAVMAKAPVAGHSKTRLCPPCTPSEAAGLAAEALEDTLDVVVDVGASRSVLALDAPEERLLRPGMELLRQRGGGLDERLGALVADLGQATVIVGMDTPQMTPRLLADLLDRTARGVATLGPAADGGWWAIGLPEPAPEVFADVPMSRDDTGRRQLGRLRERFDQVQLAGTLRDVDHWTDAVAVASQVPSSRFAHAVRAVAQRRSSEWRSSEHEVSR